MIFRQGFATIAVGLTMGFGTALPALHALRSFLAGLESGNPAYLWSAAALVTVTAGIACWIPARRATTVDPMCALRQD